MTACNLIQIPGRDAIYLFSDTAQYDASGATVGFGMKVLSVPSARAAIAVTGSTAITDHLFLLINSTVPRSIEFLKDAVRQYVEQLIRDFDGVSASKKFTVIVAGFSEDRTRRVYEIEGDMTDGTVQVEEIGDTCCRFRPAVDVKFSTKDDALDMGLQIMEVQRSSRYPMSGKQARIVGGSALAAVVAFESVTLRALKHWPDQIESGSAVDGINAGSSSNYTVDTASGLVKPTLAGTTTTIDAPSTTITSLSTFTMVDLTTALVAGAVVSSVGIYSAAVGTFKAKIVKRNSAGNFDVVADQSFAHPGTGWADATLTSPYTVPGTGSYYLAAANITVSAVVNFTASVSRAYKASDITGTGQTGFTEDSGNGVMPLRYTYNVAPSNMTVVTTMQTADASVGNARVLLEFDNTASPTLNTDLTVEVTCNGGTNWATATLSSVSTHGQGGRKVVETADTACTAGTSFAARIKTLNNKSVPIYGVALAVH
ncbi:hypothetical protein ABIA99_004279 [Bradyrhizobium sp. LB12.1]|uniref:hypothetical protein n=1 Tax=Bradyrhizobium sp. LB12.1 TaxID=3156327 RepID=UPI00339A5A69